VLRGDFGNRRLSTSTEFGAVPFVIVARVRPHAWAVLAGLAFETAGSTRLSGS